MARSAVSVMVVFLMMLGVADQVSVEPRADFGDFGSKAGVRESQVDSDRVLVVSGLRSEMEELVGSCDHLA